MDALFDEVESLEAILMEDVHIERNEDGLPKAIETTVFPVVGEDAEQQYVCVTLQVLPTPGYPDVSPEFKLVRPRGLDDIRLSAIKLAIESKLNDSLGCPVVFDLIEVVREHLTDSNLPSGQCVVCLYGFCQGDEFTRTECFHYLHSYCLGRHLNAMRRNYQDEYNKLPAWQQKTAKPFQAYCPVCRENIKDESDSLRCAMPPSELESAPEFQPTTELRDLQQRMSTLFSQQKSRGAIIDSEAEGGAILAIETEEEIRRRMQRKQEDIATTENSESSCSTAAATEIASRSFGSNSESATPDTASLYEQHKDANGSTSKTGFSPVVQQTQREDPTNSSYNHGRRHTRGGRRHQHHHYHQHQSQRDRERFEHNHIPSSSTSAAAVNSTSHSSGSQASQHNHKQAKGHAAGHGHSR